jgi:tetratricopeptide (TPR) repeat protein
MFGKRTNLNQKSLILRNKVSHRQRFFGYNALTKGLLLLLLPALALAYGQAPSLTEMQRYLDEGYYAVAAQVEGPKIIQEYPDSAEARYLYSYALYLTGDIAQAKQQLSEAFRLLGSQTRPSFDGLNGLLRAAEGDLVGAERLLQNAFLRSRSYEIAMDWGRVAWQQGNYNDALRAFSAAAETTEGQREPWPHLNQARLLNYQGRYQEAIEALNIALDVLEATDTGGDGLPSPAYVEAYYRLGEVYEAIGDFSQAESSYEAARSIDPNYAPAISALDRLKRRLIP